MQDIALSNLIIVFILPIITIGVYLYFSLSIKEVIIASVRMVLQLLLIGYILAYIFAINNNLLIIFILLFMLIVASFITLRPLSYKDKNIYFKVFISLSIAACLVLFVVSRLILGSNPALKPSVILPLAGMFFAAGMNALSLGIKRFYEIDEYKIAAKEAINTSLIPTINNFFAIGLVALPGVMSGQILAGLDPVIAVKYQIVIMFSILAIDSLAIGIFLKLSKS